MSAQGERSRLALAFLCGAAAGAVVALLCAPKAGAEVRARIARVLGAFQGANGHDNAFVAAADSLREPH